MMTEEYSYSSNTVDHENLEHYLEKGPVQVTFTKADGTIRNMWCTRDRSLIEQILGDTYTLAPRFEDIYKEVCAVWDLEKEGFRSFRWDSVISYQLRLNT